MSADIALRYGGALEIQPVTEGWRLTCCDDDGETAVVYLTEREVDLVRAAFVSNRPDGGAA